MSGDALWTVSELVEATGGELRGDVRAPLAGVSIDSRTLAEGDIFFAIKGDLHDGHKFAASSLDAGAGLAVVSAPDEAMEQAGPVLVVDDTLNALERLGVAARTRFGGRAIAVTGSVGKTGSKEAMRLCFEDQGKTHASQASYNNHWGVPLTLSRLPRETDYGVFEVGMNHPGEITPLTKMIRPHVAIVTTVQAVHLGFFSSLDGIADAKAEIFDGLEPGGTAVLNRDNQYFDRLRAAAEKNGAARIIGFGEDERADCRLTDVILRDDGSTVSASVMGMDVTYNIGAPGKHFVINSLAVLAAVHAAGADVALAALALAKVRAPKGRGARLSLMLPGGDVTLIDESYNANPASMRAALELLAMAAPGVGGRRIAVLGDMLELGDEGPREHTELASAVDDADADIVYACGPNMAHLWDALDETRRGVYAEASDGLGDALVDEVRAGDVVMIKGSLGSRMGPLVEALCAKYEPRADAPARGMQG